MRFGLALWTLIAISLPICANAESGKVEPALVDSAVVLGLYTICPHKELEALYMAFPAAQVSNSDVTKSAWLSDLVAYVGRCTKVEKIYPADFGTILAVGQLLYPGKLEVLKEKYRQSFKAIGIPLSEYALSAMPLILSDEEACSTVELLDAKSSAGPLRITNQIFGTCYVHSAVRAMDYYSYSHGTFTVPTSIGATEVIVNRHRSGGDMHAMNRGWPFDIYNHLREEGGCQKNPLDEFVTDVNVFWLEDFFKDLNGSQAELVKLPVISERDLALPLTEMSAASLNTIIDWNIQMARISTKWNPTTIKLLNALVTKESDAAKAALKQGHAMSYADMDSYVKKIMKATLEFRLRVQSGEQLLSFAAFLLEKTYCSVKANRFDRVRHRTLLQDPRSNRVKKMMNALYEGFSGPNPQPVVMTYYSDILRARKAAISLDSFHASLIVGRKFVNNKCKVQILNSWGSNNLYDASYEFDPATGSLWISVEDLAPYVEILEQFY